MIWRLIMKVKIKVYYMDKSFFLKHKQKVFKLPLRDLIDFPSLIDELDEKKVKDILAGMGSLGNTIKSLDLLEASVRAEELTNSKVRGGGELNPFELAK